MRAFISKTLFFFLLVFSTILILFVSICWYFGQKPFNKNPGRTVVFGDSRLEFLYNNKCNLAYNSEGPKFSYYKLVQLNKMNKIDTLFLGFAQHTLSSYFDEYNNNQVEVIPRYFTILPGKMNIITSYRLKNIPNLVKRQFDFAFGSLLHKNNFIVGGYDPSSNSRADSLHIVQRINYQYYDQSGIKPFCATNLDYFSKIKQYCTDNHITLILVATPVHKDYHRRIPAQYTDKYAEVTKGLHMLDISHICTEDTDFLLDGDHVSIQGSLKATRYIDSLRAAWSSK